ncbi:MAG: aldose 1-epimerase family protein [Actinomycetota bacterium]|nr:aldose 1-epimerase family protein [Actinomycetota bacterium]
MSVASARPPSGEQISLELGPQRATVVEVGGGLRAYALGNWDVVDGYGVQERCTGARGQPLIPWPNRLRDGRYRWKGAELQLDLSEPAVQNAIHGLVRWRNWEVRAREPARVVLGHVLHGEPGYPFMLGLEIEYALAPGGLTVTTSALNIGAETCPYGAGMHPYFSLGAQTIDDAILKVPAAIRLLVDERGIPVGEEPVDAGPVDFRAPREIGGAQIDTCFTGLMRDQAGFVRVELHAPHGARQVTVWASPEYEYLMVYTGDTLAKDRRRRGVAIEPMTCAPDAFRSGAGLVRLEPGERHAASWGIEPSVEGAGVAASD